MRSTAVLVEPSKWMKCKHCLTGSSIFLFNTIDFGCAVFFIVYSSYLGINGYAPHWLYEPLLILGCFLLCNVILSWCGAMQDGYNGCLWVSSWMFVLLAIGELILAIVILTEASAIDEFLRKHQEELNISDKHLRQLEMHKFIPVFVLLGLVVMEMMRFMCSGGLISLRQNMHKGYHHLLPMDERDAALYDQNQEVDDC